MNKWVFIIFIMLVLPFLSFGEDLPFSGLSESDQALLERSEPLFRIIDSRKDMRLKGVDAESRKLLSMMKKVDPNFLSEIIMVVPVEEGPDYLSILQDILMDVTSFDDISYYSARNERNFPLFEDTRVLVLGTPSGGTSSITVSHTMKPFRPHEARYEYSRRGNSFFFSSTNTTAIYYNRMRAVREGNMLNLLWIQDRGDHLVAYGAGGASVFSFFGLFGDRMDDSFSGRVEAFFSWFYDNHISAMIKQ